jgi:hypothetical protein
MPFEGKGLVIMPDTPRSEAGRTNWTEPRSRREQDIASVYLVRLLDASNLIPCARLLVLPPIVTYD